MIKIHNYRYLSSLLKTKPDNQPVTHLLKTKINLSGPLTVADYMKIVLTSKSGYYMLKDVFGKRGDFITSPEVSQLFGEMVGVWAVNELIKLRSPRPLQFVELGPGRGTMTQDILRVFTKLDQTKDLSVHLVELSPVLSKIQSERLCEKSVEVSDKKFYRQGVTSNGIPVFWYHSVKYLPNNGFTCLFANELFDSLPIHKFEKTDNGWREVLIDFDRPSSESKLRYVISRNPTPALVFLGQVTDGRNHVEVCPEAGVIMEHLAGKFESYGGMALIIDYGHLGDKQDTFRAFKQHKVHDPLVEPGSADLTADVDFSYLKKAVGDKLIHFGPVSQAEFLKNMHIEARLKVLMEKSKTEEDKNNLMNSYNFLISKEEMGERFKVMSFFPSVLANIYKKIPVAGF